jgi:hypothetical protein
MIELKATYFNFTELIWIHLLSVLEHIQQTKKQRGEKPLVL